MISRALITAAVALLLGACSQDRAAIYYAQGDKLEEATKDKRVSYTFEAFVNGPHYRSSRDIWRGPAIEQYAPRQSHVEILLDKQRGRLYIRNKIAMDFPICSGRFGGMETPAGTFRISQKVREHRSNRYGSFVDATGKKVKRGISSSDKAPAGTRFEGTMMPYWMRFNGAIGMHVGDVHRDGASHGCVRVPTEACSILFEKLAVGSKVIVK